MTPGANEWRWVDANGVDRSIDRRDLIAALVDGTLSADTLVWRPGWSEWIPASRVAELAPALPADKVKPSRTPPHDPRMTHPPPVLDAAVPTLSRSATFNGEFDAPTVPGLSRGVPVPVSTERGSLPTLMEEESLGSGTTTLRPPGAVPPPPRGVPRTGVTAAAPGIAVEPARHQTPVPGALRAQRVFESPPPPPGPMARTPPRREEPPPSVQGYGQPSPPRELRKRPALPTIPDTDAALQAAMLGYPTPAAPGVSDVVPPVSVLGEDPYAGPPGSSPPGAPMGYAPQALPPSASNPAPAAPKEAPDSRPGVGLIALASVAVVVAIGALVLLFARNDTPPVSHTLASSATVPQTATDPTETPPATVTCKPERAARRIAGPIELSVPPYLDRVPNSSRFALGFAARRTTGVGFTVDPETLSAEQIFEENGPKNVLGVVPVIDDGKLAFVVDRDDLPLRYARSIDTTPRITVGMADRGFAQWTRGTTPRVVWEGDGQQPISEPRIATVPGVGHAITFRRGGQTGPILFGWMAADGSPSTPLTPLETDPMRGNPMVALNDTGVLVTFAARAGKDSAWGIRLAFAAQGKVPASVQSFQTNSSGPLISPIAAGLPGGRWLLQWTDASAGSYRVRVQVLGQDLRGVGEPTTVSPAELNAGQGALWTSADRAVALFVVSQGQTREIWGATLTCR